MGRELISFSAFRTSLETCDASLKRLGCRWSSLEILGGSSVDPDINAPEWSQPLITILQISLVDLLQSLGISPVLTLGHSSGEIAAAYASGALSRDSAVKVAYYRGILSSRLAATNKDLTMMAVGISRQDVGPYLSRLEKVNGELDVQIGCINSPKSVTLTGKLISLRCSRSGLKQTEILPDSARSNGVSLLVS